MIISLFSFSYEFNAATKCVQKRMQQDRAFHLNVATASTLMSENNKQFLYKKNLGYHVWNPNKFKKTFNELT